MKKLDPIYFALDFESGKEALSFLNEHSLEGIPVKVGMELYYKEGASIIHALKKNGHSIFLDLKLHDIPETVSRSMRSLAGLDIEVINVHAQGGAEMMQAAKRGLEEGAAGEVPLLLAVTVLTSSDQKMLNEEVLVNHSLSDVVKHYGQLAEKCRVDGVVCSVSEAAIIKKETNLAALTPGIRLSGGEKHDQKRVATPAVAEEKGSDSIVVGRAIRDARQPEKTYQQIKEAFQHAKSVHHS